MASTDIANTPVHELPFSTRFKLFLKVYWKSVVVVLTPFILMPLPIIKNTPDFKCMYVVLLMATYWVTEALPLPVTSMLPVVLFPTMGILESEKTCQSYMKGTNMMFIGGLMIAAGLQHSNLHKRVALKTIQIVGCSHRRLNFGLTFVTMFISMWISNAAAVTMMVPITEAVLEVLEQQGLGQMYIKKKKDVEENGVSKQGGEEEAKENDEPLTPSKTTICYFLSIAYASSIGGIGTVVGTATNLTYKGIFEARFPKAPQVDFLSWMLYNVPAMITMQLFIWVILQVLYMGLFRPNSQDAKDVNLGTQGAEIAKKVVDDQYKALGPVTWHETSAGLLFILAVFLFFLRSPGFMQGWADVMTHLKVKDAVTAMFIVIMMFVIPANLDFLKFFRTPTVADLPTKPSSGIVTWKILKDKIPWGLLFLLGGGFALAEGSKASGMSELIGNSLSGLQALSPAIILLIVVIICELLTEFTSNVAIANIILPVLAEMSIAINLHPMYLMLPAAIACSMAFHMPVGTPPNAIVAGIANIGTGTMAITGIGPTLITTLLTWGFFPTWGMIIFPEVKTFPDWARPDIINATVASRVIMNVTTTTPFPITGI
ncbi:tricarboxylate transporter protein I'm not dead yet isoform X2 [Arctopsyche grandis]|uniref:tricarboxylate transporter protein I'm not dead yet isoform X2 n=1 Tax=Arctopsyche grandis TaxID=121162 RepID=UPI00406D81DC